MSEADGDTLASPVGRVITLNPNVPTPTRPKTSTFYSIPTDELIDRKDFEEKLKQITRRSRKSRDGHPVLRFKTGFTGRIFSGWTGKKRNQKKPELFNRNRPQIPCSTGAFNGDPPENSWLTGKNRNPRKIPGCTGENYIRKNLNFSTGITREFPVEPENRVPIPAKECNRQKYAGNRSR